MVSETAQWNLPRGGPFPEIPHLVQTFSLDLGVGVGISRCFCSLCSCLVRKYLLWMASMELSWKLPLNSFCCCFTYSVCCTIVTALPNVRLSASCILSDNFMSYIPTTILSRIMSSYSLLKLHFSAKELNFSVINVLTDSPSSCFGC